VHGLADEVFGRNSGKQPATNYETNYSDKNACWHQEFLQTLHISLKTTSANAKLHVKCLKGTPDNTERNPPYQDYLLIHTPVKYCWVTPRVPPNTSHWSQDYIHQYNAKLHVKCLKGTLGNTKRGPPYYQYILPFHTPMKYCWVTPRVPPNTSLTR
jgi:hypothetical protein